MGSAEIVDSRRFTSGRSNFSQMCTLLSQYLKKNGSFGDLQLGLTQTMENKVSPVETMNLFPMIEKSGSGDLEAPPALFPKQAPAAAAAGRDETLKKPNFSGVESAQMTIFYDGQVMVFDDLPADKAKEILMLAAKSSGAAQNRPRAPFPSLHAAHSPAESATGVNRLVPTCPAQPPLDSDLPIARKNSLARFLEKRKDRITANAPYPANKPEAPSKLAAATSEPWMRLAPELIIQRH